MPSELLVNNCAQRSRQSRSAAHRRAAILCSEGVHLNSTRARTVPCAEAQPAIAYVAALLCQLVPLVWCCSEHLMLKQYSCTHGWPYVTVEGAVPCALWACLWTDE